MVFLTKIANEHTDSVGAPLAQAEMEALDKLEEKEEHSFKNPPDLYERFDADPRAYDLTTRGTATLKWSRRSASARERWAEEHLRLVQAGFDDETIARLREFVLSPSHSRDTMAESELRLDVEAGLAAVRAWVGARRGMMP